MLKDLPPNTFVVYIDGMCPGNLSKGGWGAIIIAPKKYVVEIGGHATKTTNNRMELTAAIKALKSIKQHQTEGTKPSKLIVHTNSLYLHKGITEWIYLWRENGWKTSKGKSVINSELWSELYVLSTHFKHIKWTHVKSRKTDPGIERAEKIALAFARGDKMKLFDGSVYEYGISMST
jgi:ribonuclease HI